jgi:flavin reductase (DIM6/NTAB) family NADH-FMN oxidoreductase RutF
MDLAYGSEAAKTFITNVGLITSNGSHGHNIMAAEWTHHISYDPPLILICPGKKSATYDNISQTKQFGIAIAASDQNILCSLAGKYTGKTVDKIAGLQELGFSFSNAKSMDVLIVDGVKMSAECDVIFENDSLGDHVLFVGKAHNITVHSEMSSLPYHDGKYWELSNELTKPYDKERVDMNAIMENYVKE